MYIIFNVLKKYYQNLIKPEYLYWVLTQQNINHKSIFLVVRL